MSYGRKWWFLPSPLNVDTLEAWDFLNSNLKVNLQVEDMVTWNLHPLGNYTTSSAFNGLAGREDKVTWHQLVWSSPMIPRCSFILWLVLKQRLPTKDRLLKWGIISTDSCCFCNSATESLEHLFFSCPFTNEIWRNILLATGIQRAPLSWRREISWFCRRTKGKSKLCRARRLSLAVTVYQIWQARIFQGKTSSVQQVYLRIRDLVLLKLNY